MLVLILNFLGKKKGEIMFKFNKSGNIFSLIGIQEEKDVLTQTEPETIRPEDISSLIGKTGTFRQHYPHTDYDSDIQQGQNDD